MARLTCGIVACGFKRAWREFTQRPCVAFKSPPPSNQLKQAERSCLLQGLIYWTGARLFTTAHTLVPEVGAVCKRLRWRIMCDQRDARAHNTRRPKASSRPRTHVKTLTSGPRKECHAEHPPRARATHLPISHRARAHTRTQLRNITSNLDILLVKNDI